MYLGDSIQIDQNDETGEYLMFSTKEPNVFFNIIV